MMRHKIQTQTTEAKDFSTQEYCTLKMVLVHFNLIELCYCGDVHPQPGPTTKKAIKYPCKEGLKPVRSNQDSPFFAQHAIYGHTPSPLVYPKLYSNTIWTTPISTGLADGVIYPLLT